MSSTFVRTQENSLENSLRRRDICSYSNSSMCQQCSHCKNVELIDIQLINFFQAINGPLQQRTVVLDIDSIRANTFPDDYENDLEFFWANLSEIL